MLCILYITAVGACLGLVALLFERVLPEGWPRRAIWSVTIPLSVVLPAVYRTKHASSLTDALTPLHTAGVARVGVLDPAWWQQTTALNPLINRVWVLASALLLLWGVSSAIRVAFLVHRARADRSRRGAPAALDGVPVLVTESVGPATVGVLRSHVLVPRWVLALPDEARQYIVRHEEEHRRARDAALLFVASLSVVVLPWNLALWWQLRRLHLAVEIDCDRRVVGALGDAEAYGAMLLKVAEASSRGPRLQPALLGGIGMLERRLTTLLAPTPLRHIQRLLLPAAAIALLFAVLSMPHPLLGSEAAAMAHRAHSTNHLPAR